jgi:ATP-dependent DNA helicase RecG
LERASGSFATPSISARTTIPYLEPTSDVQFVRGVGPKRAQVLKTNGINTAKDLIDHLPRRYLDRTHIIKISDLQETDEEVTVIGRIGYVELLRGRKGKPRLQIGLDDDTGVLNCVWFEGIDYWKKVLKQGLPVAVSGKIGYYGALQMIHPAVDVLSDENEEYEGIHTGRIIPIYPSAEPYRKVGLDSRGFRKIILSAWENLKGGIPDVLPPPIRDAENLCKLNDAYSYAHIPQRFAQVKEGFRRLKFDEFFALEVLLAIRRRKRREKETGISFTKIGDLTRKLIDSLPFELTQSQKKVLGEIRQDMKNRHPMNRMLQGDVGSGKTVVAVILMTIAAENGYQSVLMAPTEVLAEQHARVLKFFLSPIGLYPDLLIGAQPKPQRQKILERIASGQAQFIVGTHAVFQEMVEYHNLGFVVIDEQHRFGVTQRLAIRKKGIQPDVLVMTATPIPRSLAMTIYGDLDVSLLSESPVQRAGVRTVLRGDNARPDIYNYLVKQAAKGERAFIVYPIIEESEKLDLKAAVDGYEYLRKGPLSSCNVGLLHGRLSSDEKDEVLSKFRNGQIQILVTTTVIEVGVDVPEATIMIVEHPERFGLAQLHQLRGRVGRGTQKGTCILLSSGPPSDETMMRLDTLLKTDDGFRIAEADLYLRGAGEFFGTRQHGIPAFKIADPIKDRDILEAARQRAFKLIDQDPELKQFPSLKNAVMQKYAATFDLAEVG